MKALRLHPVLKGQSLVEAIVAIGITVLVVTGLVVLAVGAVRSATLARNRSLAVQYAQEGMEALRSIRDRSFAEFSELDKSGATSFRLTYQSQWVITSGVEQIPETIFSRSFVVTEPASGKLKLTLAVTWSDSAGSHTVDLTTYLTNWQ